MSGSGDVKAAAPGLTADGLLCGDSLLFTDAYLALWFVDSGMKTPSEWANNMNDLMGDISSAWKEGNKREEDSHEMFLPY